MTRVRARPDERRRTRGASAPFRDGLRDEFSGRSKLKSRTSMSATHVSGCQWRMMRELRRILASNHSSRRMVHNIRSSVIAALEARGAADPLRRRASQRAIAAAVLDSRPRLETMDTQTSNAKSTTSFDAHRRRCRSPELGVDRESPLGRRRPA